MMSIIKRTTALLLSLVMVCAMMTACGDDAEEISMYDLHKKLVAYTGDPDNMKYASSSDQNPADLLVNVSDIEYSKVKAFFKGNADEIVAIQVKKKSDLNEAAASLKSHLEVRKTLYSTYDKTQLPKLNKAKVFTRGTLAILMVSENSDKMEAAFYDFFNK